MFITFEGPEGCGKTTQIPRLAAFLKESGYRIFATREPGGTPIGDQIRDVLLGRENTSMLLRTEILLFQASRAQLVEQVLRPRLEDGWVVLCDRYADSTLAYQGYGYKNDLVQLKTIVDFAIRDLKPDLTLLLDLDVAEGLKRRTKDGDWNRLDVYDLDFYQRVRKGYHDLVQADPDRWVVIDASRNPDEVQAEIRQTVLDRLSRYKNTLPYLPAA
jgi:dTMP kinase